MKPMEKVRAQQSAAMPEVKRLVKKYGRRAVSACIKKIGDYDKELGKLAALKKEIAAREARLK
jgi:hypothetical protein